jgi:hypothetical protein
MAIVMIMIAGHIVVLAWSSLWHSCFMLLLLVTRINELKCAGTRI